MKIFRLLFVVMLISFVFEACQKQNDMPADNETEQKSQAINQDLEFIDPWIRPASAGTNTAFFFKVVNHTGEDDTLYGAASNLAKKTEVHETYKAGNNMMGMRHVEHVIIPAGDTVIFKPRDLHIMLMMLNNDLSSGDSGVVTLIFKNAGEISKTGVVRDMPKM